MYKYLVLKISNKYDLYDSCIDDYIELYEDNDYTLFYYDNTYDIALLEDLIEDNIPFSIFYTNYIRK